MHTKKQAKKMIGIALAAALVGSMAAVAATSSASAKTVSDFGSFGVIGGFNNWAADVAMTDEDGDGVYEAEVTETGTYEFKVRADGAWDYSWGVYEEEYDRTQNSQTNCSATVGDGQKLVVKLDTTKVDDAATANADSYVNDGDFDFETEGYDFWPVTFEVIDAEESEESEESKGDEQYKPFTTLGVIGGFNSWGGDVEMTDDDGDGIYEAEVTETGSYDFKVRADGAWDYSWGAYEEDYDRTQNSQTNCSATVGEGQKLVVKLDTTKVDDAAKANADSFVNDEDFNFATDGFDFWPVTFEVVDAEESEDSEDSEESEESKGDEQYKPFTTLGVIGGFNSWGGDVEMTDDDGDGIYEAEVTETGSYDFKVRADGAWDYSWGAYEEDYDRTQNSQTNCSATVGEGQKLVVKLDTTKVDDAAKANADSAVNDEGFNFAADGYEFWPVTFEVVDAEESEDSQESVVSDVSEDSEESEASEAGRWTGPEEYIYFDNSEVKWDEVYAYWWHPDYARTYDFEDNDYGWEERVDDEGNPANGPVAFPGTKMTQIEGTDIWQARVPMNAQKIIFNSGKSDEQIAAGEEGFQTEDLSFSDTENAGQIYTIDVAAGTKKGRGVEKTKIKYQGGAWSDYDGAAFISEFIPDKESSEESEVSEDSDVSEVSEDSEVSEVSEDSDVSEVSEDSEVSEVSENSDVSDTESDVSDTESDVSDTESDVSDTDSDVSDTESDDSVVSDDESDESAESSDESSEDVSDIDESSDDTDNTSNDTDDNTGNDGNTDDNSGDYSDNDTVKTGDAAMAVAFVAVATAALGAVVLASKKRRED